MIEIPTELPLRPPYDPLETCFKGWTDRTDLKVGDQVRFRQGCLLDNSGRHMIVCEILAEKDAIPSPTQDVSHWSFGEKFRIRVLIMLENCYQAAPLWVPEWAIEPCEPTN